MYERKTRNEQTRYLAGYCTGLEDRGGYRPDAECMTTYAGMGG